MHNDKVGGLVPDDKNIHSSSDLNWTRVKNTKLSQTVSFSGVKHFVFIGRKKPEREAGLITLGPTTFSAASNKQSHVGLSEFVHPAAPTKIKLE